MIFLVLDQLFLFLSFQPLSPFLCNFVDGGHGHGSGTAGTTNKTSTPVTSGNDSGHAHDDIPHTPLAISLRLMEVNVVQMGQVGMPKNCQALWLDALNLIPAGHCLRIDARSSTIRHSFIC